MRAIRARYDPYEQSRGRVEQLRSLGHSVDKVMKALSGILSRHSQTLHRLNTLVRKSLHAVMFLSNLRAVMGGTFLSLPESYRDQFVAQLHNSLSGWTGTDVDEAVRYSAQSRTKSVGITIETRPDYCLKPHLSQMLRYGCTRLEIGVQSVYEDVARDTNRGHTVRATCESFQFSKDAGFKVVSHMMVSKSASA